MTAITFIYAGLPLGDGRFKIHLYLQQEAPTWDLSPLGERRAINDAKQIVADLLRSNDADSTFRMLQAGDIPEDARIICRFRLNVGWDAASRTVSYHKGGFERLEWHPKWNPVAELMMEHMNHTVSTFKRHSRKEAALKNQSIKHNQQLPQKETTK